MIAHLLRFAFRADTTEAQQARVLDLMRRTASVDSVSFSTVGRHVGDPEAGYTHGLLVGIADLDALERYMYDPVHLAGDPEIIPFLARLHVGPEITDDGDPHLGAKIAEMHRGKVARYPEWDRLMNSIPEVTFG
ncbi:Dabb family protein [Nocardia sp. NEAU-G5]|uniref:Dabb family protein n=1 Tax=Nocardia albiluteola TaxID=2842303 RepID=A0ABS6AUQ1_9NOCA|nr:Dabb family protein [Nocardia albiluteola]MBU3061749.1 Dabb family protein [Nocardia albiluteola]